MYKGNKTMNFHRDRSIDYFRAFLMLLIVWHHATLAYSTTGSGVLIADHNTFVGFDLMALYNDSFFIFAFFFLSGLFSYKALLKKGSIVYLKERFIRLLWPFAFATLLINPIAHYFSSLKDSGTFSVVGYFRYLFENFGKTDANHLWFLWVLFLFSLLLVLYAQFQNIFQVVIKWNQEKYFTKAYRFTIVMIITGILLYLPLRNIADGGFVTLIKPFNMQLSRILLYFMYFIAGNGIGMYGIKKSFLFQEKFQRKWSLWLIISVTATIVNIVIHVVQEEMESGLLKSILLIMEQGMVVAISLFALYGFISCFTRYSKGNSKIMDIHSKEAMGIYVIHYAIVTALQYAFLSIELSAVVKGITVSLLTIILSLGLVIILKKVPILGTVFGKEHNQKYQKGLILFTLIMLLILMLL